MDSGDGFLPVYEDCIDKRLLEHLGQDDELHGPLLPSQGDRGSCTIYQCRLRSFGP